MRRSAKIQIFKKKTPVLHIIQQKKIKKTTTTLKTELSSLKLADAAHPCYRGIKFAGFDVFQNMHPMHLNLAVDECGGGRASLHPPAHPHPFPTAVGEECDLLYTSAALCPAANTGVWMEPHSMQIIALRTNSIYA